MKDLVQSAVRKHALACSATHKRGRFTRIGEDFLIEVESDVEAIVRELNAKIPLTLEAVSTEEVFVTGAMLEKLKAAMNGVVARIIQNKIARQPSVGCTAGRTR